MREARLESEARLALIELLPPDWIVRDIERDHGIGMEVGTAENGEMSDKKLWLRVETAETVKHFRNTASCEIETECLKYYEGCPVPVFLLYYVRSQRRFYYVFAQKYVREDLPASNSRWMELKTLPVEFSINSKLENSEHLRSIATNGLLYVFQQQPSNKYADTQREPRGIPSFSGGELSDKKKYGSILGEQDTEYGMGRIVKAEIQIIENFGELIKDQDTLELAGVHKILEENLWLIDERYMEFASNEEMKTIIEEKIGKRYKSKKRKRPDLICKTVSDEYVIIELKRPSHLINSRDLAQLLEYKCIIKHYNPRCRSITCFLLGSRFDEALLVEDLRAIGIGLKSYNEILTDARFRKKKYLQLYMKKKEVL